MMYEDFLKQTGQKIKKLRIDKGLNQLQLAIRMEDGSGPNSISDIECGRRNPTLKTLFRVAEALGVEVKELFDFNDNEGVKK